MKDKVFNMLPFPTSVALKFTKRKLKDNTVGLTLMEGGSITITVYIDNDEQVLDTVVHEAVHAVQFTENFISGKLDDETTAYLVSKLVSWMMQKYKNYCKR